jgi:long-subunit fatty acid transport protein
MGKGRRTAAIAVAATALVPRVARAGNTDSYYFSDEAAMAAGAVTANTRDSGAIWYNPAGLGGIESSRVNLSGSVLILRIRNIPGAVNTTVPGADTQSVAMNSFDFTSSPHALGIVRNLSPTVSAGLGVYVTALDLRSADSQIQFSGSGGTANYQQRIDQSLAGSHYDAGPAIGWQVTPNFRVGAALFGTYASIQAYSQYAFAAQGSGAASPAPLAFLLGQNRTGFTWLGLHGQVGIQWDVAPGVHFGATLRSPEVTVTSSTTGTTLSLSGANNGDPTATTFALAAPTSPLGSFTVVQGLRALAGVSFDVAPRMWLSADADYQAAVTTPGLEQSDAVNVRLGWRWQTSDSLVVGAGLFTDRATDPNVGTDLGQEKVDYYGGTAGITLLTPLALGKRPADAPPLVLSSTLAVRYAVGIGDAATVDLDFGTGSIGSHAQAVVYHEIVPYIGSGVAF